jgi:glycosyltransferase involved in cell wall biosynthesis
MRVLQILHDRERGGVQTLAAMLDEGLAAHGAVVETDYLYPRPGLARLDKLLKTAAMARRLARGGFDALIAYQSTASILVGTVGRLAGCGVRVVHQTCPPSDTAAPLRHLDRLAGSLGLYTANVVNSTFTSEAFRGYPAPYRRSLALIEHGIDPPFARHGRTVARARFGLPENAFLLLNVGRLVPQKNQAVLVEALGAVPDAHLAIAGDGADREMLAALGERLGVGARLHLLGAVDPADIADLYGAADLFVFSSVWETFGLAAVEAAMACLPMVVADLAVLRDVLATLSPAPVAFAPLRSPPAWAEAIRRTMARPPAAAVRRAFQAEMTAKYSRQRMIEAYLTLLGLVPPARAEAAE